jgi:hypothetical protein
MGFLPGGGRDRSQYAQAGGGCVHGVDVVRKSLAPLLLIAALGVTLGGVLYASLKDSPDLANYKRVHVGMSVGEVQAILGPGAVVPQAEVPGVVRAVNQADEDATRERARRSDGPPSTARDYPTRIKPVVEGDHILRWVNGQTGERILIAFKDGKVCEKHYWDPNYL